MVLICSLPLADIRRCAADPEFRAAVEVHYEELDAEIAAHQPTCRNRGACCRFGDFGHRLFVTPAELAFFLGNANGLRRPLASADACPYQQQGVCGARLARPAGCRIFFCEAKSQDWQPELTERTLDRLKSLHQRFDLPYAYVDWMAALERLAEV